MDEALDLPGARRAARPRRCALDRAGPEHDGPVRRYERPAHLGGYRAGLCRCRAWLYHRRRAGGPGGTAAKSPLTSGFPLAVATTTPRTPDPADGAESGYQAAAWPCATIQPPAVTGPSAPRTSSSHRVPGAIPLTCAWTCSPHGCTAYRTVAAAPVCRLLPGTVVAE